jgi:hypothetical protein
MQRRGGGDLLLGLTRHAWGRSRRSGGEDPNGTSNERDGNEGSDRANDWRAEM